MAFGLKLLKKKNLLMLRFWWIFLKRKRKIAIGHLLALFKEKKNKRET